MTAPATGERDGRISVRREGAVATVVLDRPDKLNALNQAMWAALATVMRQIGEDAAIRCVILRGAGEKAMGPGADIGEFSDTRSSAEQATRYGAVMHAAMHGIRDCPHPVIAQIHGLCVGGALELALMCDIRICGRSSRFGIPVNRLGLVMAYPEIEALIGLVGRSTALEILYEARVFDAAEAKDKGLVNRVVDDDQVAAEVAAAAQRIVDGAPLVNRWHKKFANKIAGGGPRTPEEEAEGFACFDTEDFRVGYQAFLEKEKPIFKGE
jgi:enoyl-CoA hydratase/carnithine racemase